MFKNFRTKKTPLIFALGFFALTFIFLIAVVVYFNITNAKYQALLQKSEQTVKLPAGTLIPSQILQNKAQYNQQRISVRGKVAGEPVVCEKKQCPANDSCCGCPAEKSLSLADPAAVLTQKALGRFELLSASKGHLCQRQPGACTYDCQDWQEGTVYDITGVFYSDSPPPGWKLSLDYYFLPESKNLVSAGNLTQSATNLFDEIKQAIQSFRTSGSYVLP